MKRIALFLFLILSAVASFAQTQIDPTYQIQWNLLSGSGAPSITCTQNGNYTVYPYGAEWGQSYQDTTNNVRYNCTSTGWMQGAASSGIVPIVDGGTGATTAAGALTNLGAAPLNGVGTSGTWPISTTGNAATATTATSVPYSGLTGTVPTWNQSTTGNAATATNVAYTGLTGTVPTWNQNTTGNAATATTATSVPYSGLTGTVPTWNQSTTGNAATATTTTGNAATATALAATPGQCSSGNYATGIAAAGTANCGAVQYSQLGGTVTTWNQNTTGNAATATTAAALSVPLAHAIIFPDPNAGAVYTASQVLGTFYAPNAGTVPASGTGTYNGVASTSVCNLTTAATASTTFTFADNGTSFGTVVFAASGTTGTFTISSAKAIASGDKITLTGPATADATAAGLNCSLVFAY